jgi:hypothetical protein
LEEFAQNPSQLFVQCSSNDVSEDIEQADIQHEEVHQISLQRVQTESYLGGRN